MAAAGRRAAFTTPLWGLRVIRLDGYTGTAKTALLAEVAALGGQVIDLEGLARHRGSILGDMGGEQPAQKGFETALVQALGRARPRRAPFWWRPRARG